MNIPYSVFFFGEVSVSLMFYFLPISHWNMIWGEDHTQIPAVFFVWDDLKSYCSSKEYEDSKFSARPCHFLPIGLPLPQNFSDHGPAPCRAAPCATAVPWSSQFSRWARWPFAARRAARWPVFSAAGKNGRLGRAGFDVWSVEGDGWPTGWRWWEMGGTKIDVVLERCI